MDLKSCQMELGRRIKALREEQAGLGEEAVSFARLAKEINARLRRTPKVAAGTLQKWEVGKGHPDPWALIALAKIAGVSVEEFVYPPAAARGELAPEAEPEEELPADEGSGRRYKR